MNSETNTNTGEKSPFFLNLRVDESGKDHIEQRFDTLCNERGITFADFYNDHEICLDKSQASKIRRGILIPPLYLRVKIAKFFGVDSSVIWRIPDLITADKIDEAKK